MVRRGRDLPTVIDCCRGEEQVVFALPVEQRVKVNHLSAAVRRSAPEKRHLLNGHFADHRQVRVPDNLVGTC